LKMTKKNLIMLKWKRTSWRCTFFSRLLSCALKLSFLSRRLFWLPMIPLKINMGFTKTSVFLKKSINNCRSLLKIASLLNRSIASPFLSHFNNSSVASIQFQFNMACLKEITMIKEIKKWLKDRNW
jgi:hypothetical protein